MLYEAKIPFAKVRNSVLSYATISCFFYIVFLLLMKMFNLLHVTELRMVNYFILCGVCLYEIRRWVFKARAYVPFLQVFYTSLFTGVASFILFSLFLFLYTRIDPEFNELFIKNTPVTFRFFPTIVIIFEGSAASIIVAFINLQYFRRYEEGEASPGKTTVRKH